MPEIRSWKLSDFFTRFPPRFVLGTTYTASPVFFETSILPKIDRRNMQGCVVLCDRKGFEMAAQEVGALRAVSTIYSLVYPNRSGAFHPKVWIMANDERAAVLCGSGNLTQSGFMDNVELFDCFEITRGDNKRELGGELLEFVGGLLQMWPPEAVRDRPGLRTVQGLRDLLQDLTSSNTPADQRTTWFLSSFRGGFAEQLSTVMDCEELRIASPYFGGSLAGATDLVTALAPGDFEVFPAYQRAGAGVDLEPEDLVAWQDKPLRQLDLQSPEGKQSGAFAHLKLYGLRGSDGLHYSLTGSINATQAALTGPNIEAGILRTIDKPVFDALFAARSLDRQPVRDSPDYGDGGHQWIGLHAILHEPMIILSVDHEYRKHLPLREVSISWICGARRDSSDRKILFDARTVERFREDQFPKWIIGQRNAAALEIRGVTVNKAAFRSFVLIESFAELTATPLQRGAAAAIRALLSGEGIPEAADISSVFQLLTKTLDGADLDEGLQGSGSGTKNEKNERAPAVPIWPPKVFDERDGSSAAGAPSGNIIWFQRILSMLLREPVGDETIAAARHLETSDAEGESGGRNRDATPPKEPTTIHPAAIKAWLEAERNFERLEERLLGAVAYARPGFKARRAIEFEMPHKERLLPVAWSAFLTAFLLHPGRDTKIDDKPIVRQTELVARFLRLMVDDRRQLPDFALSKGHPYRSEVFPPILEDVVIDPDQVLLRDFSLLFVALFAVLKVDAVNGTAFPTLEWLKFRHFTRDEITLDEDTIMEASSLAMRYVIRGEGAPGDTEIRNAIETMREAKWNAFVGYQRLQMIHKAIRGAEVPPEEKAEIENWATFLRRLSIGGDKEPIKSVDRFQPFCIQSGCQNAQVRVPGLHPLENLMPCVCSSCGTALVPALLQQVFDLHEN